MDICGCVTHGFTILDPALPVNLRCGMDAQLRTFRIKFPDPIKMA
jgi:hypothetical protein